MQLKLPVMSIWSWSLYRVIFFLWKWNLLQQWQLEIFSFVHDDVIKWNIFRITGHLCGTSPVTGEFPTQRPVTRSFDVFLDLPLNKRLSKQSRGWWFEAPSRSLWRHCNAVKISSTDSRSMLWAYLTCDPSVIKIPWKRFIWQSCSLLS